MNRTKADALKNEVKDILIKHLESKGYDDAKDYVDASVEEFENSEGDKGIKVELRNDLVGWYDLDDEFTTQLDNFIQKYDEDAYFEPDYDTIWNAIIFKDTLTEELETRPVTKEDDGVVPTTYASAIQDIEKYDKIRKEYTKMAKMPERNANPKNPKMVAGAKKMKLDESLFEDWVEPTKNIKYALKRKKA